MKGDLLNARNWTMRAAPLHARKLAYIFLSMNTEKLKALLMKISKLAFVHLDLIYHKRRCTAANLAPV